MKKFIIYLIFLSLFSCNVQANELDAPLDLFCLRKSYPSISGFETDPNGNQWLLLRNNKRILYSGPDPKYSQLNNDVKNAMLDYYPLEPGRINLQPDLSPGRKRSYEMFEKIYGATPQDVKNRLKKVSFLGKSIYLSPPAANAFASAASELEDLLSKEPDLKKFLVPEGGFYWRKIAGENVLSPHSYGIALDLGVKASPYWRWNSARPHPLQETYPQSIVKIMEKHGFIWGGKWEKYDLMHYEYRPEILCKSSMYKKPGPPSH